MPVVESQADDEVTSGLEHRVAADEASNLKGTGSRFMVLESALSCDIPMSSVI